MFIIWALLNTCEYFDFLIMRNPSLPILPLFSSLIELAQDHAIKIVMFKNYIEVGVITLTVVVWMAAWCAPICGIVLIQALRIKFMGSNFTKKALASMDQMINLALPDFLYQCTVRPIKS